MKAAGGSSVYYEPDPFTCKCYPDFPDAMMSLPRFPFFPLTHGSPPVAMPSDHAGDPTEIQSCESQLYNIEACFQDIVNVLLTNKLKIGPACCKSVSMITQVRINIHLCTAPSKGLNKACFVQCIHGALQTIRDFFFITKIICYSECSMDCLFTFPNNLFVIAL
ncbi:hypothetical protein GQ457_07G031420 [Hibiscus cannabinus]